MTGGAPALGDNLAIGRIGCKGADRRNDQGHACDRRAGEAPLQKRGSKHDATRVKLKFPYLITVCALNIEAPRKKRRRPAARGLTNEPSELFDRRRQDFRRRYGRWPQTSV